MSSSCSGASFSQIRKGLAKMLRDQGNARAAQAATVKRARRARRAVHRCVGNRRERSGRWHAYKTLRSSDRDTSGRGRLTRRLTLDCMPRAVGGRWRRKGTRDRFALASAVRNWPLPCLRNQSRTSSSIRSVICVLEFTGLSWILETTRSLPVLILSRTTAARRADSELAHSLAGYGAGGGLNQKANVIVPTTLTG